MYKNPAFADSQLTPLERAKLKIKQEKMNSSIGSDQNGYSSRERASGYLPLRQKSGGRDRSFSSERQGFLEQNNAHTLTVGPHGGISIYPNDKKRSFQEENTLEERKTALREDNDREDQMSKYLGEQSSLKKIRDKVFGQDLVTRGPNDHELSVHGDSDEPEDIPFDMDNIETSFIDTTQDQISELAASKGEYILSKITNLDRQKSPNSATYTSTQKTAKVERDEKNSDVSSGRKDECGIGLNPDLKTMEVAIERSADQFMNTSIRHSSTKDLSERRTIVSHGSQPSPLRLKNPPNLGTTAENFKDYYNNDLLSHQYLPSAINSTRSGKAIRLSDNPTRDEATTLISSRQYIDPSSLPVTGTLTTNLSQPNYQIQEATPQSMSCVDNLHLAIVIREPVTEKLQKSASCSTGCSVNQLRNAPRFGTSQSLKNALRTGTDSQRTMSTLNAHNRSASKSNVLDSTRSTVLNRQNQVLAKDTEYDFTLLTTQVPSKFLFRAQKGLQANLLRNLLKREQDVPICAQAFGLTGVPVSSKKRALRLFEVDSCIDEKQGHNLIGGLRKQVEWLRRKPHLPPMVDSTCNHVFLFGQTDAKKSQLMSVVNQDSFLCSLIKSEIRFMRVSFFYFGEEILLSQKSFQTKSQAKREVGMELREAYRSRDFHIKKIAMKQSTFQKSVKTEEVKAACHMVVQLDNLLIFDMAEIDSLKDPSIAKAVSTDFSAMTNAILSISPFYRSQDLLKKNSATAKLGSNQFFNFLQTTITAPSKVLLLCCAVENSMPGTQAVQYCNKIRCFFRGRAENAAPQQIEQVALAAEVQSQVCENSKDMIGHKINVFRQLAALLSEVEKAKAIIEKVYTQQLLGEKQRNPIHEPVSTRKFHQLKDLVERTRDDVGILLNELAFSTGDYYKSQLAQIKELLQAEIQIMNDKASCIKHKSVSRNSSAPSRSASSVHRHNSSHQGGQSNLKKKSNQVKMHPATNPQPQQPLAPSSTRSACRSQKVTLKRPISRNRMTGPPDRSALIFKHGQKVFEGGNHDFKNSASATFGNLRGPNSQSNTIQSNTLTQFKGCRTPSQQSGPTRLKCSLKVNMTQQKRPSSASRLKQRIKDSEIRCQAAEVEYKIILQKKAEQKRLQKEHSKMLVEDKSRHNSQLASRHLSNRGSRRSNRSQMSPNNPDADSMYVMTTARQTPKQAETNRYHISSRHSSAHNGRSLTPMNHVADRSFTPQMGQRQSELQSNKSNSRTDNEDLTDVAVEGDYVPIRQGRRSQRDVSIEPVKLAERSRSRTRTERGRDETHLERELKDKSFERSNSRHRKYKKGYRAKDYVSSGSKSILETSVKKDTNRKSYLDTTDSQFIGQKTRNNAPALTQHSYLSSSSHREPVQLVPEGVRIFTKEAEAISNSGYTSHPQPPTNYKEIAELREKLELAVSQNSEMTKARRDHDKQMRQQRLHCLEMEARVKQLEQSCQEKDELNARLQKDLDFRNKTTPRTYTEQAYNELLVQKKQTDEVNAMILQQISQLKEAVQDFRQTEQLNSKLLLAQKEKDSKIKRLRHSLKDMQSQMQKQLQLLLARDAPSDCQENDDKTSNATSSEKSKAEYQDPKSKKFRADTRIEEEVAALRAKVNVLEQAKDKFRDQTLDLKTEVRRLKTNLREAEDQIEGQSNSQKSGAALQDIKGMIQEYKQDSKRSQRSALASSSSQQVLNSKQSSVDGRRTSAKH